MPRGDQQVLNTALDGVVTDALKRVLSLTAREAAFLGHTYIGNEHLLYGLVEESESLAARVLAGFGLSAADVRKAHQERVRTWVVADAASRTDA